MGVAWLAKVGSAIRVVQGAGLGLMSMAAATLPRARLPSTPWRLGLARPQPTRRQGTGASGPDDGIVILRDASLLFTSFAEAGLLCLSIPLVASAAPGGPAARPAQFPLPHPMERLAEYFKVFSEPNRLAVLMALRDGPRNVTAVVEGTGLSQALVSKHLKLLTIAAVVRRRPEGSLVFYDVIDPAVFTLLSQAEGLLLAARRQQFDALAATL